MSVSGVLGQESKASVFDAQHWASTLGVILGVTLFAFEGLAIVTIAPLIADALAGRALYGWIFSGFLLASLLGTVIGGRQADRTGPARPFILGLVLFASGLLISGFAPTMVVLVVGRVVQGLGGGAVVTALYAAVNVAYPDSLRPRIVALMSSAWVVPALVGPSVAGLLAEAFSWRVVFWGMVPLLLIVVLLAYPAFRKLEGNSAVGPGKSLRAAFILVIGAGLFLVGLSFSNVILLAGASGIGIALALFSLRQLLPEGTLSLRSGLPSLVAARGLFYASFAGVQAFLALMLTSVHGFSPSVTGVALATGAISWTAGSWLQDYFDKRLGKSGRGTRIFAGTLVLGAGLGVQLIALFASSAPLAITVAGWLVAGFGIGLAHSTSSVLAFALAPAGEEGAVASALQLSDQVMAALSTGVGGALFAYAAAAGFAEVSAIAAAFLFSLALGGLGVVAAYRVSG